MAQSIYNSDYAKEEEKLIEELKLNIRQCTESGLYKDEKLAMGDILHKVAHNNYV